jgi:RHS repeat-associated protein
LVAKYTYTVAPTGHRLTAAENVVVTNSVRTINRIFTYDATYRLTHESLSASGPVSLPASANVGYALDDVGNRLSRTTSGFGPGTLASTASTYDANDRLTSDTYDANGNTKVGHVPAGSAAVNDVYDFEDHLVSRNNGQVTVTYDGDGNRVAKTVGGVTTLFLVDDRNPSGYAQVLEEHVVVGAQSPTLNRAYTYGSDLISEDQWTGTAWTVSFYGYDGHGNVRYLFTGEQYDGDLGLYYLRARYQNTDTGRFWTIDSYEGENSDPPTLHKYLYANGNPANEFDPSGNMSVAEESFTTGLIGDLEKVARTAGNIYKAYNKAKSIVDTIQLVYGIVKVVSSGALEQNIKDTLKGFRSKGWDFSANKVTARFIENFYAALPWAAADWAPKLFASYESGKKISAYLIYLPNPIAIGISIPIPTGIKISGIPLELRAGGTHGGSLLGVGLKVGSDRQFFRMDAYLLPAGHGGSAGLKAGELDAWNDWPFHYHVMEYPR